MYCTTPPTWISHHTIEVLKRFSGVGDIFFQTLKGEDTVTGNQLEQSDVIVLFYNNTSNNTDTKTTTTTKTTNTTHIAAHSTIVVPPTNANILLLKHVDLPALRQRQKKTDQKWRISLRSFDTEYNFYQNSDYDALHQRGIRIPKKYFSFSGTTKSDIVATSFSENIPSHNQARGDEFDRKFIYLFQYLSPDEYIQYNTLDLHYTSVSVAALARFHAHYWGLCSVESERLSSSIFARGCWWRKYLRPTVNFKNIPIVFSGLCKDIPLLSILDIPENHQLIQFFTENIDVLDELLTNAKSITVVHGDFKSSNLFFRKMKKNTTHQSNFDLEISEIQHITKKQEEEKNEVYFIDFQWTGLSPSGMSDVVYLIAGAVMYEVIEDGGSVAVDGGVGCVGDISNDGMKRGEKKILEWYYKCLRKALDEKAQITSGLSQEEKEKFEYSWETCLRDYRREFLDYFKTAVAFLLDGMNMSMLEKNRGRYGWLTHEFDERVILWMCNRALSFLRDIKKGYFGW